MDTRDKIIDETFTLLLLKGYDGVSITDIQNSIGISRGLLYHYFGNKETLFLESIKHKFSSNFVIDLEFVKEFNIDLMTQYIISKYETLDAKILKGISILNYDFLFYRAIQQSKELARIYINIRKDEQASWLTALKNSHKNNELRQGLNLEKLSLQYIYITDGVWLSAVTPSIESNLITTLKEALETFNTIIKNDIK